MKKVLDILIVVLLTVLIMNLFSNKTDKTVQSGVIIKSTKDSYTIPPSVGLEIKNTTKEAIDIDSCKDIKIHYSSENVPFDGREELCKKVTIPAGESQVIDYTILYNTFLKVGNYSFKVSIDNKEYIYQFDIQNPGTIRKLFTAGFYAPIYNLLVFLTLSFQNSLGFGIIAITIILRFLLLYPQHKMMVSQKKLQAIQPKIKAIQKQYKGQQQVLGMKLMELYKKEKVNPVGSLGFLLIQLPILLVIYNIILHIKDPSNSYYLYSVLSHFDLSSVSYSFFGIELLASGGLQGGILGLCIGGLQFIQVRLSLANKKEDTQKGVVLEKKKGDSDYTKFMPDPKIMNKFMLYGMPLMVAIFTYHLFAGVGFYWGIGTLFMIVQQLIVNKKISKSS